MRYVRSLIPADMKIGDLVTVMHDINVTGGGVPVTHPMARPYVRQTTGVILGRKILDYFIGFCISDDDGLDGIRWIDEDNVQSIRILSRLGETEG